MTSISVGYPIIVDNLEDTFKLKTFSAFVKIEISDLTLRITLGVYALYSGVSGLTIGT